ncbi:MAG: proton-conducting transporter transmembrane domain-containing protein [Polyangiales bacterium]
MNPVYLFAPALLAPGVGSKAARPIAPWALVLIAGIQACVALAIAFTLHGNARIAGGYLITDATARLFLVVVNVLFFGIAVYVWSRSRAAPVLADVVARYARLSLVFMAAANFVVLSNHLLASWVALEVTTLAAAPLIVREGVPSSRRASWRYFLFSAVGLGIALVGLLCLARGYELEGRTPSYFLDELSALVAQGPANVWRRIGVALLLLGYGTKLGLAPMYAWLPETYDEAPPAVTALLAAVQFNCALVCVIRVVQVFRVNHSELVATELLVLGLASMAVSTISIIATRNFKRLIAYASINHAGVIAIGLGVGGSATYGLLLYVVSNAFIKAILFLTAGRIKAHYGTKDTREIAGLLKDLPFSGVFFMVGTFALLGFPPFGSFLGELIILSGLVRRGQIVVFVLFCTLIAMTFVATGRTVFPMIWGVPKREVAKSDQTIVTAAPKLVFLVALVAMGIYMPAPLNDLFRAVAASIGGR